MKPSKVVVSAGGSLISALLSFLPLTCCILPVAFSFLGAGGLALAMDMMQYRLHFIALTIISFPTSRLNREGEVGARGRRPYTKKRKFQ